MTKSLDGIVKPFPYLQLLNVAFAMVVIALEMPIHCIGGSLLHRHIQTRIVIIPMATLPAILLYQTTNAALYYILAMSIYIWGYCQGEVCTILLFV